MPRSRRIMAQDTPRSNQPKGERAGSSSGTNQSEEKLHRRANELAAFYETMRELGAEHDLTLLLETIVKRATALLGASGGALFLYEASTAELRLVVASNVPFLPGMRVRLGEGIPGRVAQTRQPLLLDDTSQSEYRLPPHNGIPFRASLYLPMDFAGKLLGVLGVYEAGSSERRFTREDESVLTLFAAQAAIAVSNASILAESKQRAERLALLNHVVRAVSTTLNLDELLGVVHREITEIIPCDAFFIALYDQASNRLDYRIRMDEGIFIPGVQRPLLPGVTSSTITGKRPILIRDFEKEEAQLPPVSVWGSMKVPSSWLSVPMLAGDNVVGVISLQAYRPCVYDEPELEILSTIADTVALAVANARLFESTERNLKHLATLREIDHTLSAMLDLGPMLETMLDRLEQVVPFDSAAILFLDGDVLRAGAVRGREQVTLSQFRLEVTNNPIFQQMANTRAPIVIQDLLQRPDWVAVRGAEFARSWLGAPLIARGQVIGQIGLFSDKISAFTQEQSELLGGFANHAAITIANVRLHGELHEQARHDSLTEVLNHGTFIEELRAAYARGEAIALIMLDLDGFKRYNDTYGHVVGDQVLRATVQAIRAHLKQSDFVGRWGGEEFGIALRGANAAQASQVAERIRATLAKVRLAGREGLPIAPPTASQGIAVIPGGAGDIDELIDMADRALYRAKALGRDQVAHAEERR